MKIRARAGDALASPALPRRFPANWTKEDRFRFLFPYIIDAARRNGTDAQLLTTVCDIETTFQPELTSPKGARGLTQLMPATAARFGVIDAYDLRQALDGGAKYLRYLTGLFNGNLDLILAGYNSGEGNVIKYGLRIPPFSETQGYVARGRAAYLRYLQAQFPNLNVVQQAGNVRAASGVQIQTVGSASAEVEDEGADAPLPTRSIVFGGDVKASDNNKENNQSSLSPSHVTRSIKFQ